MGIMSSIYNSDFNIEQLFLGSEEITEMYLGDQLVFSKITNNLFYKLHEFVGSLTVRNTIEAPVKSAILKGQTLVNIAQQYSKFGTYTGDVNFDGEFFSYTKPTTATSGLTFKSIYGNFEIGKQISIYVNNQSDMSLYLYDSSYRIKGTFKKGVSSVLFTTDSDSIRIGLLDNSIEANIKVSVMMFEGDCTNCEIPYFTGMQSVKMPVLTTTGKNMFDGKLTSGAINGSNGVISNSGTRYYTSEPILLQANLPYTFTISSTQENADIKFRQLMAYKDKKLTSFAGTYGDKFNRLTYTSREDVYVVLTVFDDAVPEQKVDIDKVFIQIEQDSTATTYEPHKSNILSCNEEVILRSNGNVYDELNLLTGKLTQRIDEDGVILTSEVIKTVNLSSNVVCAYNGTTHYTCSSEEDWLLPTVCIEVPIEEVK